MDSCVSCGAGLGVGRFCLNCGHPIGAPAPAPAPTPDPTPAPAARAAAPPETAAPRLPPARVPVEQQPIAPPVQAADPTPVAPTSPPDVPVESPDQPPTAEPPAPAPARPRRPEWDPRQDLLPYEEVDEVDLPAVRGHAWLFWVAGAALLLVLALVLLKVFESDDVTVDATAAVDATSSVESTAESSAEAGATDEAAAGQEPTTAPRGVGKRRQLAGTATFDVPGTAPPTQDFDGALVSYDARQMGDGDPSTAWRIAGDATGQKINMTLPATAVIRRLGIVNGYAKNVAGVAWYPNNRRILTATWQFADGSAIEQTFAERPGLQMMKVPPVATRTLSITINAVTPPGSGDLGRDYTAISEVSIIGQRAG